MQAHVQVSRSLLHWGLLISTKCMSNQLSKLRVFLPHFSPYGTRPTPGETTMLSGVGGGIGDNESSIDESFGSYFLKVSSELVLVCFIC